MKNIAIIGSGVSGLVSAYLLSREHNVLLFEKNSYLGGHTATVDIEHQNNKLSIDTGFIVFNDKTYPRFMRLLSQLGITPQKTEMSFSVTNLLTGLEYNGHSLATLFAQKRNIFNPKFWLLIKEILRFNNQCKALYERHEIPLYLTLGSFLEEQGFSEYFCQHYILPMGAAIWSCSLNEMRRFELAFFIRFFHHHGLLNVSDRPQWYVVPGGSREYITPLIADFKHNIQLNSDIISVSRNDHGATLLFADGLRSQFDEVIFACHSDQALSLLADASELEKNILGNIRYKNNDVILHTDISLLPKRRKAWASWNYQLDNNFDRQASVTYNMNILQGLKTEQTFCVTLNQNERIDPDKIIKQFNYAHPLFNQACMSAQQQRNNICGVNHTHFVGAYWYNGFHEDGVRSATDIGERFGIEL
ncbi:NAD(P)-binding protein [Alteromonadaceae bacterium BrNp21-10]|nr:NAD(P)-binding protein [Alteromonadaceae bacterium BrNp21-10]